MKISKLSRTTKSEGMVQDTAHSKRSTARRRIHAQTVQNVLLTDCSNTINQLRQIVNDINVFTDRDQCVDLITDYYSEHVCMMISDTLCEQVVPLIHDVAQLHSIFILSENKTKYKQWANDWSKIKDVFTDISVISEAFKRSARQCKQNDISISFIGTSDDVSKKSLDQLDPSFMYTQILKEIMFTINFEKEHIKNFFQHCRDAWTDDTEQLNKIKKVERTYHDKTPIWWYSCDCFLFPMLNSALRLMDIDIIIKIGFFMKDLHQQIEELHKGQFDSSKSSSTFIVYRGQGLSTQDFEKMKQIKSGLIAFNNFLSTSRDREVSRAFAESNKVNPDLVGIFFVITVDPTKSTTSLASIKDVSFFPDEDEVLFAMNSIFRIDNITPMDENLFQVELILTNDNDEELRMLTDRIRSDASSDTNGWYRLSAILMRLGQPEQAEQVYEVLLEQATNEHDKAYLYNNLGWAKFNRGEHEAAIGFYEKSLKIYKKSGLPADPDMAWPYSNLGSVYKRMREYSKALSSYKQALAIRQQLLPSDHCTFAYFYYNIGSVYNNMHEYSKALSSYEKALVIRQQLLPPNHPDLASSYSHIGWLYNNMGDYSRTLSSYEKALVIRQQSLPSNHPDLIKSYNNLGSIYKKMGDYAKALSYYEKTLTIRKQTLPSNHPDVAKSYDYLGWIYKNMDDYSTALLSYEKALAIRQQSLPPDHLVLAYSFQNIGSVYNNMHRYSKALLFYEKALAIRQQSLSSSHPDLEKSYDKIRELYENVGNYSKALMVRSLTTNYN